jgi:hypothetical protein
MICPLCFGRGKFPVVRVRSEDGSFVVTQELPCPECQGSGIASCCDTAGNSGIAEGGAQPKGVHNEGN